MLAKTKPIRSRKLRDSARGERCTFQIIGVCNDDPETTVLCHLPDESHGMGRKSDDICAAYGCSACHDAIDGRTRHWVVRLYEGTGSERREVYAEAEFYIRRAMVRTWRRMIEKGLIKIA